MKKVFLVLSLFLAFGVMFAASPYDGADSETKEILAKVDDLIEKKQYESAFNACVGDNEFILCKRTEIQCTWFVQSIMHTFFAFKNLEEGEDLMDLRRNGGSFNIAYSDKRPDEILLAYLEEHGENPVIRYALGYYYYDVIYRYNNQWLMTVQELSQKTLENFEAAYESGIYTEISVSEMGCRALILGNVEKAIKYYSLKSELGFDVTVTDEYNLGIAFLQLNKVEDALSHMLKTIDMYEEGSRYQFDAYYYCVEMYFTLNEYDKAIPMMQKGIQFFEANSPLLNLEMIYAYCRKNNKKNALKYAKDSYNFNPENAELLDSIKSQFARGEKTDWLDEFLKSVEK